MCNGKKCFKSFIYKVKKGIQNRVQTNSMFKKMQTGGEKFS